MPCDVPLKLTRADVFGTDGSRAATGDFDLGTNQIKVLGAGTDGTDAVTLAQLNAAVIGFKWTLPCDVLNLIGAAAETVIEATSEEGDSYIVSALDGDSTLNPGALPITLGDVVQLVAGVWTLIRLGVAGFVEDGFRAVISGTSATVPIGEVANDIVDFDGTSNASTTQTTAANGDAILTIGAGALYENKSAVFDSTPGEWVLFGTGITPTPGDGLADTMNIWAVVVSDIIGFGMENDGSNNIRNSTANFGAGFAASSGGGTIATIGAGTDITVNANDVQVNRGTLATAFADAGLVDATDKLAVGEGVGVTVSANDVAVAPAKLIQGGDAEIDGDFIDVDFAPTGYTEETGTVGGVTGVLADHLTAHLGGISTALLNAKAMATELVDPAPVISGADGTIVVLASAPAEPAKVPIFMDGIRLQNGAGLDASITGSTVTAHVASGTGTGTLCDVAITDYFEIGPYEV